METKTRKNYKQLIVLGAITFAIAIMSMCFGAVSITPAEIFRAILGKGDAISQNIIMLVRLPRTLGCIFAGAALATSGAIIQTVLANPLAAPNVIGVNSGAGLAVAVCSALVPAGMAAKLSPFAAFAGAFIGVMTVLLIAEKAGASKITLVLAGIAISGMFSAGIDAVVTLVPDALLGYSDFRIGGLANVTMEKITPAMWIIALSILAVLVFSNELDLLALGSDTAQSLGLPVRKVRVLMLGIAAALAGAAVSFSGLLGFVGLIAPHMIRKVIGSESKFLVVGCALGGAAILTVCDIAARVLFAPYELPVGIILSLAGGPFFLWILFRERGGHV